MDYRKKILILLGIEILMFIVGFAITYSDKVGFCEFNDDLCIFKFPVFSVGHPLIISAPFLIFVSVLLLFFKDYVFNVWKKFAIVFIIFSIIIITLAPEISEGFIEYSKKYLSWRLSELFLIISLGIIIWKSIKMRAK